MGGGGLPKAGVRDICPEDEVGGGGGSWFSTAMVLREIPASGFLRQSTAPRSLSSSAVWS